MNLIDITVNLNGEGVILYLCFRNLVTLYLCPQNEEPVTISFHAPNCQSCECAYFDVQIMNFPIYSDIFINLAIIKGVYWGFHVLTSTGNVEKLISPILRTYLEYISVILGYIFAQKWTSVVILVSNWACAVQATYV